jgi:TetR/AcrR family tetracycline transcriptional repressor
VGLSRAQIVEAAYSILRQHGLAGLSMRRLAQNLGVQPGALYYYVDSKQELLVAVAERILSDSIELASATEPGQAACDLRAALLQVRDSADVVSFAHAYKPDVLGMLRDLPGLFSDRFPPQHARWAAQTLIHYVLGFVAEEQNRAELIRAKILPTDPGSVDSSNAFSFGVSAILHGLASSLPPPRHT